VQVDHLFAVVDGEASLESVIELWDLLREKCKVHDLQKVLILYHIIRKLRTMLTFEIGVHIAETSQIGPKIVFVDSRLDYAEQLLFGEDVLSISYTVGKVFRDISDTEKWLEVGLEPN
jgi:hypothetical protein